MAYIDREKLIEKLERTKSGSCNMSYREGFADAVSSIKTMIKNAPTEDVAPIKHGKWELCYEDYRKQLDGDKCSVCGFEHYGSVISHYKYCPNCGAKMDLVGSHRETVSMWERGRGEPKVFSAILLADVFGVSLDELCCRKMKRQVAEDDVIKALEKQIPKKVTHEATLYWCCTCPTCKNVVDKFEDFMGNKVRVTYDYCHFCGQALKWSDDGG